MVLCFSDFLFVLRIFLKVFLVCSFEYESNYWVMLNKVIVRKIVEIWNLMLRFIYFYVFLEYNYLNKMFLLILFVCYIF